VHVPYEVLVPLANVFLSASTHANRTRTRRNWLADGTSGTVDNCCIVLVDLQALLFGASILEDDCDCCSTRNVPWLFSLYRVFHKKLPFGHFFQKIFFFQNYSLGVFLWDKSIARIENP
jgi:hypothetical protein